MTHEGLAYFPSWVVEARTVLAFHNGYVDLKWLKVLNHPQRTVICLEFTSQASLTEWSQSEDHKRLLAKLRPFLSQKSVSTTYLDNH